MSLWYFYCEIGLDCSFVSVFAKSVYVGQSDASVYVANDEAWLVGQNVITVFCNLTAKSQNILLNIVCKICCFFCLNSIII